MIGLLNAERKKHDSLTNSYLNFKSQGDPHDN